MRQRSEAERFAAIWSDGYHDLKVFVGHGQEPCSYIRRHGGDDEDDGEYGYNNTYWAGLGRIAACKSQVDLEIFLFSSRHD